MLYIFTISHYCEKARWALDYLGIDVDVQILAPGTHIEIANKLGLKRGSVPFLRVGEIVIQGSDAIIHWAEQENKSNAKLGSLNPEVIAVEKRLDDKLGVHIRRWFYSEAILEAPALVKPIFMHGISAWEKLKLTLKWPIICRLMTQGMDLGHQQGLESLEIIKQEIEWLESLIGDRNSYLVGNTFSRSDITAASLLAPLVTPSEYSCSKLMSLPPRAKQESEEMVDRLFWNWVEAKYKTHRS
jgi:glutathione S-transferase